MRGRCRAASLIVACAVLAHAGGAAAAEVAALSLTPGQWKLTTRAHMDVPPALPPDVAATLTPEQQEGAKAAMAQAAAEESKPREHVVCLTADAVAHGFGLGSPSERQSCKRDRDDISTTVLSVREQCAAGVSRAVDITVADPHSFSGTGHFDLRDTGADEQHIATSFEGHFIKAQCDPSDPHP